MVTINLLEFNPDLALESIFQETIVYIKWVQHGEGL